MDSLIPLAAALALLLFPGSALAWAWGVRDGKALAYAPTLSAVLYFLTATVLWLIRAPYIFATTVVCIALIIGIGAVVRRLLGRAGLPTPFCPSNTVSWSLVFAILGGSTLLNAPPLLEGMKGISLLNGAYDAFFHYSAIAMIREEQDAFAFTALSGMYGGETAFYPTTWHALAVLIPGDPVVAANALMIALYISIPLSALALVRAVLPNTRVTFWAWVLVAVVALYAGVFESPVFIGAVAALWPFLFGLVALIAGVAALLDQGLGIPVRILVILGVLVAHPSAGLSLTIIAGIVLTAVGARYAWRRRSWFRGLLLAFIVLTSLAVYAWIVPMKFMGMQLTELRPHTPVTTLLVLIADRPRVRAIEFDPYPLLPLYLLGCVGLYGAMKKARIAGIIALVSIALAVLLTFSSQDVGTWFSALSAPWYGARERIQPILLIGVLMLAALGVWTLSRIYERRNQGRRSWAIQVVAWVLVVVLGVSLGVGYLSPSRHAFIASLATQRWGAQLLPYVTESEREFIEASAKDLPSNAVVLGSPLDGTSLYYSLGGVRVVYPSLAAPQTLDGRRIGLYSDELSASNPVCGSMKAEGVSYVYMDESKYSGSVVSPEGSIAYDSIHRIPHQYLSEVERSGDYVLYSISLPCA